MVKINLKKFYKYEALGYNKLNKIVV